MDEILVTNKHGRGRPAIVGLGSEFVVIWTEPGNQDLRGARFDMSGSKLNDFQVNTTPGIFGLVTVEKIPRGFVVAWVASPPSKLVFQRFDLGGTPAGPETVVSDEHVVADLERMQAPAVAFLLDGNFVVSWVAAPDETQVHAAIFNSMDGEKVVGEFRVNSSAGFHFAPSVVGFGASGLDDVAFLIAWSGGENGNIRPRFRLFGIDGTPATDEVLPRRTGVGEIAPAIFTQDVNDPREFISVLGGMDGNEGKRITADLFIRDGTSLGATVSGPDMVNFDPRVTALPNSRAVVTWTQKPIPTTGQFGTRVMAVIVGVEIGPPHFLVPALPAVQVGATDVGGQMSASPMVDESGGTHIAFTWVEQPSDSPDSIKARVLTDTLT